jgi:hypothetical protein
MAAGLMGRGTTRDGSRESESEQREHDSDCDESDLHSHIQRSSVREKQSVGRRPRRNVVGGTPNCVRDSAGIP